MSNKLLLRLYNQVFGNVHRAMLRAPYIAIATDGWSRTQGSQHVYNFMACGYGFSYFLDMFVSGREKVRGAGVGAGSAHEARSAPCGAHACASTHLITPRR